MVGNPRHPLAAPVVNAVVLRVTDRLETLLWRRLSLRQATPIGLWRGAAIVVGWPLPPMGLTFVVDDWPLAKAGVSIVGIDRSVPMLARARTRLRRLRTPVSALRDRDPPARTAWSMQLRFGNGCEIECVALAG